MRSKSFLPYYRLEISKSKTCIICMCMYVSYLSFIMLLLLLWIKSNLISQHNNNIFHVPAMSEWLSKRKCFNLGNDRIRYIHVCLCVSDLIQQNITKAFELSLFILFIKLMYFYFITVMILGNWVIMCGFVWKYVCWVNSMIFQDMC